MKVGPVPWTPGGTQAAPGRGRAFTTGRRWLLPVSLLANVFLLAHAAGPWLRPQRQHGFGGMVEHFAHSLPPGDAERFRAAMERQRPFFDDERRGMDRSRLALSRAIAANPYDPALTRQRMDDWQAHLQAMSGRFGATLLAAIPDLSPEGRARLADAADQPPPGPPAPPAEGLPPPRP